MGLISPDQCFLCLLSQLGNWDPSVVREKQALKKSFAWSPWEICMRTRGIRFWTHWFHSTDYQRCPSALLWSCCPSSPASCSLCHSWLPVSQTDHNFHGKHMWAANTVSPIMQSCLIHRVLQPEIPSEGGVSCKVPLWGRKRLRYLSWTAKRPETQWPWIFSINPAQEPPNTLACFAMVSSYFYRLLYFHLTV